MARGGFKQKRGGGRSFSKHLVLNEEGTAVSVDKWEARGKKKEEDVDEEEEEEEEESSEEEESEEETVPAGSSQQPQAELTRTQRKELKKSKKAQAAQKEEGDSDGDQDPLLRNPNITVGKTLAISDLGSTEPTRREREEKAKKEAKERYMKLHLAGKTDEAKADMARLAKIRAEREAAAAKRKAEAEAKVKEAEAKRKEQSTRAKR